jgi:hypothetical protein
MIIRSNVACRVLFWFWRQRHVRPSPSATLTYRPNSCTSLGVLRASAISIVQLQDIALSVPTVDHERAAIVFVLLGVPCHHNPVAVPALQGLSCDQHRYVRGRLCCSTSSGSKNKTTSRVKAARRRAQAWVGGFVEYVL